jgi:hypothetical protein
MAGLAEDLVEREAAMLSAALETGTVGLSSSRGRNHLDAHGQPMPSRLADDAEFARPVGVVDERVWQVNVEAKGAGDAYDAALLTAEVDRNAAMTPPRGRLSWTPFVVQPGDDTVWRAILEHNHHVNDASGRCMVPPQVSVQPMSGGIIFTGPSTAGMIEGWAHAWAGYPSLTPAESLARLADESLRAVLRSAPADCRRMMALCYDRSAFSVSPSRPRGSRSDADATRRPRREASGRRDVRRRARRPPRAAWTKPGSRPGSPLIVGWERRTARD